MTDKLPFAAAYLKLNRARGFIDELERELHAYHKSDPVTAIPDYSSGSINVHVRGPGDLPGAVVGDAIHNLRTALDLMASELARMKGQSDKDVYFPFSDKKETLPEAIKRRSFHRAGADAVALLYKLAPYRGGNDALRAIHDLDIQDKHTTIIVIGNTMRLHLVGSYNLDHRDDDRLAVNTESIVFKFGGDEGPFIDQPVIETLKKLVELVEGIVKAFAALSSTPRE